MQHPKQMLNVKTLFVQLCDTLEKLDKSEIDVATAAAMTKVHAQINNYLNYELKRTLLMSNPDFKAVHRNLELKNFDSLPE